MEPPLRQENGAFFASSVKLNAYRRKYTGESRFLNGPVNQSRLLLCSWFGLTCFVHSHRYWKRKDNNTVLKRVFNAWEDENFSYWLMCVTQVLLF